MAFTQTNAQRELASRKILEELQLKKQLLLKQGAVTNLNNTPTPILPIVSNPPGSIAFSAPQAGSLLGEAHAHTTSAQRTALQLAHSQSFGSFITQDSSFGNLILPVIPRFDTK